jgi:hypothetical protein
MVSLVNTAYAASDPTTAFAGVVDPIISNIVNPLIMLMFAVAIIIFVWGVVEMIMKGDDSSARSQGQSHMLYGVIGMAIMLSAWGIVYFISNTISGR